MTQETLNILIGALIGFIPSAILALVTLRFQMYQKEKEREWYIEDLKRSRNREVTETRIDQIEKFFVETFYTGMHLSMLGETPFINDEAYKEYVNFKEKKSDELSRLLVYTLSLDDAELSENMNKVMVIVENINNLLEEIIDVQERNGKLTEDNINGYNNTLSDYTKNIMYFVNRIIQRLDKLRKNLY